MKQGKGFRSSPKGTPPLVPQQTLQAALTLHQQGELVQARRLYEELLKARPDHFDALHLSGLLAYQTNRLLEAESLFKKAIRIKADFAPVYSNYGLALHDLKRFDEAIASYDKAISLNPADVEAMSNRGLALQELQRLDEAVASFDRAIALAPDYALAWLNRGLALRGLAQFERALASFDKAIALDPNYQEAWLVRGLALQDMRRMSEAFLSYNKALVLKPDYAEAYSCIGNAYKEMRRLGEAVVNYDKAIALKADYADAYSNRGLALQELNRFEEALESYDQALRFNTKHAEAYSNRGITKQNLGRLAEALKDHDKAIDLKPDYVEAHSNRALTLKALKRFPEALAECDKALSMKPDFFEVRWNKGLILLLTGQLEDGWKLYESRKAKKEPSGDRPFNRPLWLGGENLSGKTILVHREQGLGDTIQFCRYIACLNDLGAHVLFAPQRALYGLLKTLSADFQIVDENDPALPFDYHAPLLSLPLAFKTDIASIPGQNPYLKAEDDRVATWRRKIGSEGFKIGICWQGSTGKIDAGRSFPLSQFHALAQLPSVRLISLHKGEGEAQLEGLAEGMRVETLGDEFDAGSDAFLDTAAVMQCCDLVVTSDTAVGHLAGALGVRTWMALQYVPDWRWLMDRTDCPWYPTMRLFRQSADGDWDTVFAEIKAALAVDLQ